MAVAWIKSNTYSTACTSREPKAILKSPLEILNQLTLIYMFAWINRVTFVYDISYHLIFVELLEVEVHHFEIVIGRLRAASRILRALQDMPLKKAAFGP